MIWSCNSKTTKICSINRSDNSFSNFKYTGYILNFKKFGYNINFTISIKELIVSGIWFQTNREEVNVSRSHETISNVADSSYETKTTLSTTCCSIKCDATSPTIDYPEVRLWIQTNTTIVENNIKWVYVLNFSCMWLRNILLLSVVQSYYIASLLDIRIKQIIVNSKIQLIVRNTSLR